MTAIDRPFIYCYYRYRNTNHRRGIAPLLKACDEYYTSGSNIITANIVQRIPANICMNPNLPDEL